MLNITRLMGSSVYIPYGGGGLPLHHRWQLEWIDIDGAARERTAKQPTNTHKM